MSVNSRRYGVDTVTRRDFARRAAALGIAVPGLGAFLAACGDDDDDSDSAGSTEKGTSSGGEVRFASYGGSYNENIQKAYLTPFSEKTGVDVTLGENAALALLKAQVESGSVQWDIVELTGSEYEIAAQGDLLEPLDPAIVKADSLPSYARAEYGIKYALFLFVMAWDQREIPDGDAPEAWADFWDVDRFKTKRAIHENLADGSTLEAALMADGVPITDLYPLDVERALASLDKLGGDTMTFYSANEQPIQLLSSGELSLAMSFNGRVVPAQNDGAEIGFTPNQGVVTGDFIGVTKESPNKDAAMELINFIATDTDAAAQYMELTTYANPNPAALKQLPAELASTLPTSPELEGKVVQRDDSWWNENLEQTQTRFKEWQLSL